MTVFEPRTVSARAWRSWVVQAFALQSRAKLKMLLAAAGVVLLWVAFARFAPLWLGMVAVFLSLPLLLGVFIYLAAVADQQRGWVPRSAIAVVAGRLALVSLFNGALLFLIAAAISGLLSLWVVMPTSDPSLTLGLATQSQAEVVEFPSLFFGTLVFIVLPLMMYFAQGLIPTLSVWFLVPLVMLTHLSLGAGYRLSRRAERRNWENVNTSVLVSLAGLGLILVSGGILALIVLPFLGALQYVSFRDVFLAQSENSAVTNTCLDSVAARSLR